ncbi:MAG: hypothetical protein LQ346_005072 [Caloplaca aetnensis]|nr:MAG: hypothetical protein LQ346_005072 [Caloplaca aetnensis]
MDPGTAIAVVTLSGNVASIIRKYYKDVHGAQDDINSFTHELEDLGRVMQRLQESVDGGSKLPVAASLDASIKQALLDLETLESKLVPRKRTKAMRPFGKSALIWPFAKGEVERWVARFQRLKDTANLALNIDQT